MSSLILPESVQLDIEREKQIDRSRVMHEFNTLLREVNPALDLVWASERANVPGLVAGRWHVRYRNQDSGLVSYWPVEDNDGAYVEPHSGILEELRANDLRNGGMERIKEADLRRRAEREQAKAAQKAERIELMQDLVKVKTAPGIRYGGSWTAKAGARAA